VTGFTNSEEKEVKYDKYVPFLLEDALKDIGGVYSKADNWKPHCVVDGRVITGQNNHSTDAVAKAVLQIKI
jgi:putative intracellular protease/amidase